MMMKRAWAFFCHSGNANHATRHETSESVSHTLSAWTASVHPRGFLISQQVCARARRKDEMNNKTVAHEDERANEEEEKAAAAVTGKFVANNDFTLFDRYVCFPARVRYHM